MLSYMACQVHTQQGSGIILFALDFISALFLLVCSKTLSGPTGLTHLMNYRFLTKCLNISVNDNKFYIPTFCMQVTNVLLRLCV